eukprot:SAG31_NODE_10985_length_1075_cov_1.725410_1_plen_214_part_00
MRAFTLAAVLMLALLGSTAAQAGDTTTAVTDEDVPTAPHRTRCTWRAAADVARSAAATCGGTLLEEALRSVTMPAAAARRASEALARLGFLTALDLKLLGGGQVAAELLAELKVDGLNFADRAKVRLLVGDWAHLERLSAAEVQQNVRSAATIHGRTALHSTAGPATGRATAAADRSGSTPEPTTSHRRAQAGECEEAGSSPWGSDTIIVVSE